MNHPALRPLALAAVLLAPLAAPSSRAQEGSPASLDSGRLIVLERGTPVGYEDFAYERRADSILVSGAHTRTVRNPDGSTVKWVKRFSLVVDGRDFGLRGYTSNLEVGRDLTVKGVVPGDTAMTVYTERDGAGTAERLEQPPGRLFVMDPPLFSLFDVICRHASMRTLPSRPVELVTLGEPAGTGQATLAAAGTDTIRWAGKRMITRRYTLTDESGTFVAWVSPEGHMLRLLHAASGLEVLREEPAAKGKRRAAERTRR